MQEIACAEARRLRFIATVSSIAFAFSCSSFLRKQESILLFRDLLDYLRGNDGIGAALSSSTIGCIFRHSSSKIALARWRWPGRLPLH
jgi:hypothetical protein